MSISARSNARELPSSIDGTDDNLEKTLPNPSTYLALKRCADIVIVFLALLPVLLTITLAAMAILFSMGRPIFFRQDRVGPVEGLFRMLKLRTMRLRSAKPHRCDFER